MVEKCRIKYRGKEKDKEEFDEYAGFNKKEAKEVNVDKEKINIIPVEIMPNGTAVFIFSQKLHDLNSTTTFGKNYSLWDLNKVKD